MTLQMAAINGDPVASNMVTRVATAVGANPSEGDRLEAWLRLLKEDAKTSEGAVQPTKRTKNAHVRRSVQANLFGAPVSDQVILEQFAALSLEHKRTLEDAIAEANRLPFGLAGYAFTNSMKTMHQLSQRLDVGMLWVNQPAAPGPELPFGGMKDSGYGSEGGPEALEAYLNTKTVSIFHA